MPSTFRRPGQCLLPSGAQVNAFYLQAPRSMPSTFRRPGQCLLPSGAQVNAFYLQAPRSMPSTFRRPGQCLLPSGAQVNAFSHLLFLSIRRICPTHFHLLNLTSVLIVLNFVFARISRFDTTYGHRIYRIRLKHLKKMYLTFCCLLRLFSMFHFHTTSLV